MSSLIPAAVAAAVGYHGAAPPQLLVLLSIFTVSIGISLLFHPGWPGGTGAAQNRLALSLILAGVAAVSGSLGQRYSAAAAEPVFPVGTDRVTAVTGKVVSVYEGDGGVRVDLSLASAEGQFVSGSAGGVIRLAVPEEVESGGTYRFAIDAFWESHGVIGARATAGRLVEPPGGFRPTLLREIRNRTEHTAGDAAPLLRALLIGEDDYLAPRTTLFFRDSGTLHLLALSGMHLGVIALVVGGVVRMLFGKRAALVAAVVTAAFYVFLVGPRPGLVRAALLLTVAGTLRIAGRKPALIDSLAATYVLHLLLAPMHGVSVGFLLSYTSLLGIALFTPLVQRWGGRFVPAGILSPCAAGIGAQVATLPVVMRTFGIVYPVGVVATAVLAPLVLLFMVIGAIGVAVQLGPLQQLLVPVLEWLERAIEWLGGIFSRVPGISLSPEAGAAPRLLVTVTVAVLVVGALFGATFYRYHRSGVNLEWTRR